MLAIVYVAICALGLAFAEGTSENDNSALLKSASAYVPRRHNPCDADADRTQYLLPPKPTNAQCKAALSSILHQPWDIAAKYMETVSHSVFNPMFQWFVDGPVATAQQFNSYLGVGVQVYDASGYRVIDVEVDGKVDFNSKPSPYYDSMRARATNIPSFLRFDAEGETSGYFFYDLNIWNGDGQMYTICLYTNLANLPVV